VQVPGALGPILTTGVALSAAVVVVANPVTAPHADVQIPAAQAQVSQAGQALDMLDEDFIKAVGPKPAGSTNPLAVLKEFKDLVSALVTDAADLGRSAVLHAFTVGANVVSRPEAPELTAMSHPFVIPPAPEALPALDWPVLPGPVPEDLRPVVEQALTAIIADYRDIADAGVIAAAFAAGAALAAEGSPLLENLRGLVDSQLQPALDKSGSAVSALPHTALGDVIRDAVTPNLPKAVPSMPVAPTLPGRAENPGADLAGAGATAVGDDVAQAMNRKPRPITVDRTAPPLLDIGGADSTVVEAARRPVGGQGQLGGSTGLNRSAVSDVADKVRGSIGRAVKAHVDRAHD
jgi:hypothetical protein